MQEIALPCPTPDSRLIGKSGDPAASWDIADHDVSGLLQTETCTMPRMRVIMTEHNTSTDGFRTSTMQPGFLLSSSSKASWHTEVSTY